MEIEGKLDNSQQLSQEQTRMAVDIVAGLSETEAVIQYRRLIGISQGSFHDSWN